MPRALDEVPWSRPSQFVVGLDIGTTYSCVTFADLRQNSKPFNDRVTHWPSRVGLGGASDAKTPSVLFYDSQNRVKATGAAVTAPSTRFAANKNGWNLVRYFKLQMHPPSMVREQKFNNMKALPQGLSVERVYADMISYMLDHTRDFFNRRQIQGLAKWEQLVPTMNLVVAHPNGWGLKEQDRLRHAIVLSGVMNEQDAQRRVFFVPEAEAAVHYVLWEKSQELQPGDEFIVCDAGGSTVDTTAYRVLRELETAAEPEYNMPAEKRPSMLSRLFRSSGSAPRPDKSKRQSMYDMEVPQRKSPIQLKELKSSDCRPAGGVLVNEMFTSWLKEQYFALPPQHPYNLELCTQKAEESFEANCKREFSTSADAPSEYVVEMATAIEELGYPDGSIILQQDVVCGFFDAAVTPILQSIKGQLRGTNAKYIFLVGGFGASQYLRQRVVDEFRGRGMQVMFLDDAHGKAASDGSIIWFVRQGVVGRAARMSFGLQVVESFNPASANHREREPVLLPNGRYHVKGRFDLIVQKDSVVDERYVIRRSYTRSFFSSTPNLGSFTVELFAWTSDKQVAPEWVMDANGNTIDGFSMICEINADLSGLQGSLKKHKGAQGTFYGVEFDLCLEFGGVELKAFLEWKEKNITRRSNANIIAT